MGVIRGPPRPRAESAGRLLETGKEMSPLQGRMGTPPAAPAPHPRRREIVPVFRTQPTSHRPRTPAPVRRNEPSPSPTRRGWDTGLPVGVSSAGTVCPHHPAFLQRPQLSATAGFGTRANQASGDRCGLHTDHNLDRPMPALRRPRPTLPLGRLFKSPLRPRSYLWAFRPFLSHLPSALVRD